MPEKNKAILLEANAAIAEGNNEGFLSFCDDDTQWTFVGDKTLNGKEAVRRCTEPQLGNWGTCESTAHLSMCRKSLCQKPN